MCCGSGLEPSILPLSFGHGLAFLSLPQSPKMTQLPRLGISTDMRGYSM